ncbi:MAG: BamA/OMP85 family outer membrane protein [Acidobacteriaceae bacterium]
MRLKVTAFQSRPRHGAYVRALAILTLMLLIHSQFSRLWAQHAAPAQTSLQAGSQPSGIQADNQAAGDEINLWSWEGLPVSKILFEGVTYTEKNRLPQQLPQQPGQPFDAEKARESLRRLFATGRYRNIELRGVREGHQVVLIFTGLQRMYVGRVKVMGIKNDQLVTLLERASKLELGTPFYANRLTAATADLKETLAQNGYYEPVVTASTQEDAVNQQVNVTFTVKQGKQARVGDVAVAGDPGMTVKEFRKKGKLKEGSKVDRDTVTRALSKLRTVYQKKDRLEASVRLESQAYIPLVNHVNYDFNAKQGPVVRVVTEGLHLSKGKLKKLVPVYEEGTIDEDLLNEGSRNIRDALQQQGFFDAKVRVDTRKTNSTHETVVYDIQRGIRHKVTAVNIYGNKYFDNDTLRERMKVQKADAFLRHGRYSSYLLNEDVEAITSLYHANGFDEVKITTSVKDVDKSHSGEPLKTGTVAVQINIDEGPQQKFGEVKLEGIDPTRLDDIKRLMNTSSGQPYSLSTLSGDRDAILAYYLSNGFSQARIEIAQSTDRKNRNLTNVTMKVTEGAQVFVDKVLVSGLHYTRPDVVHKQLLLKPGDPLDQSALLGTQRNLYNLALFNEVNTAIQNPTGDALRKNVLIQLTEARRWDVNYGFGFEAQTGTPTRNCPSEATLIQLGLPTDTPCSPQGKTGVSPRVSLDLTRSNLRGRDQSITISTSYGTLEKRATAIFNNPHFFGSQNFGFSFSGGYTNVQDITTFASSRLQASFRLTEKANRANTLIYEFTYRRVKVDPNSLQISGNLIPLLSQPVRVGGPGLTWIRDTRTPSPLDATRGSYTSVQNFFADSRFGSEADFDRVDVTNSTYYAFGKKKKLVVARNTRIGFEPTFGSLSYQTVPLPERLYAGGASSHRGFSINAAGPRDLQTGYPIGGTSVFVNSTELRLPSAPLPVVGEGLSFVLFHDMGNVFTNISDMWPSFVRIHQPDRNTCKQVQGVTEGTCNFNYFSHAVGAGLRYKTPVGPLRLDFSYNLNPPIYPVIYDYESNSISPHVGNAGHFNFFFSIGQSF